MTLLRTTLLSSLLATVVLGASAAPRTEVIPLNYRTADDVMATCAAMLSVFIREPEFQGQTKDKLATS